MLLPGVTVQFTEPTRFIEVVPQPYCFPSLGGMSLKGASYERHGTYSESENGDLRDATFYNVHYIAFPAWDILGLTVSFVGASVNNITAGSFPTQRLYPLTAKSSGCRWMAVNGTNTKPAGCRRVTCGVKSL
jgi:hypothetical protein